MNKKKTKVEKFILETFPVDVKLSASQLSGLDSYKYEDKGIVFEGETEFHLLTVTGHKLDEEPVDEHNS